MKKTTKNVSNFKLCFSCLFVLAMLLSACGNSTTTAAKPPSQLTPTGSSAGSVSAGYQEDGFSIGKQWTLSTDLPRELPVPGMSEEQRLHIRDDTSSKIPEMLRPALTIEVLSNPNNVSISQIVKARERQLQAEVDTATTTVTDGGRKQLTVGGQPWDQYIITISSATIGDSTRKMSSQQRWLLINYPTNSVHPTCYIITSGWISRATDFPVEPQYTARVQSIVNSFQFS